jgi:molybdate transport system regulatory protein
MAPRASLAARRSSRAPSRAPTDPAEFDLLAHGYPNLKGWLSWDGTFLVGPRYIRLLEGVDRTGTIRAACLGTGMSYRTCLNRIRQMERTLGAPMLTTTRGGTGRGGAALTPTARKLVRVYRLWREEVERASQRAFARATRRWARALPTPSPARPAVGGGGRARQ